MAGERRRVAGTQPRPGTFAKAVSACLVDFMTIIFIKRTQPQAGEVTLRIYGEVSSTLGAVEVPPGVSDAGTALAIDHDAQLGAHQAITAAVEIAQANNLGIGVIDEKNLWRPEWGTLEAAD